MKVPIYRLWEASSDFVRGVGEVVNATQGEVSRRLKQMGRRTPVKPLSIPGFIARVPNRRRVYAVGDIHGRADLLFRLMETLREDIRTGDFDGRPILIFLGDYVDRGFQSRDVLNVLLSEQVAPFETYFLKGNHEAAMIQFLSDPSIGPKWAEYGGIETLVSYGVKPPRTRTNLEEWAQAAADLNAVIPHEHRHFLENLDLSVRIGDYVFVHAGVRPGVPIEEQVERDLLWIRDEFLDDPSHFGAVVVHGHTPTNAPYRDSRRIGLDTGAYLSGRLTAARFEQDLVEFISTGSAVAAAPVETDLPLQS